MITRSLVHLVIRSALITWCVVFLVIFGYASTRTLSDENAKDLGITLVYNLLDQAPPLERSERLRELKQHSSLPLDLISRREVEARLGRALFAGQSAAHKVSNRAHWLYLTFSDGAQTLAVGPIDLLVPKGITPVGFYLIFVIVPLLACLWLYSLEGELNKIERASQAIASGVFNARVDNQDGPSRELAASFNQMAERIEALIKSRDELIQAISHELGSPLTRLRLRLSLLEAQAHSAPPASFIDMKRELDQLDELVAELLTYVQSSEQALSRELFHPNTTLSDLIELAGLDLQDGSPVHINLRSDLTLKVYADRRHFQRAIENLLRNAARHASSQVLIEVFEDESHVMTAVHDDGCGIPEEQREKVLLPFVRLEDHQKTPLRGVGLGLSIVHQIQQQHQGELTIERSPLGGAVVTLSWPKPHAVHA